MSSHFDGSTVRLIDSTSIRTRLRAVVALIGEKILGFTKDDVGLHSIRSGGAMAMFLSGVSEIIIQRIGRWDSDAFLEYIREQVENFTFGVSKKMLQNEQFFHLNNYDDTDTSDIADDKKNEKPTYEWDGEPLCVPYSIHYDELLYKKI